MSVQITCLGWHWYPYRYSRTVDDGDGRTVAGFPDWLSDLGRRAVADAAAVDKNVLGHDGDGPADGTADPGAGYRPDVALVNWYGPRARMGMHADREEPSAAPVVSVSVGDRCLFRFGTAAGRGRPWSDVELGSGDLFVFGGPSRRAFHGVPRIFPGTGDPSIGPEGGRFNVTIRESGLTDETAESGRAANGHAKALPKQMGPMV
jgi:alkylated DNA repair protein (DNA oxidative demethylase)